MNIGKAIKLCRVQRGLNQRDLAERADISTSYLSLLERGHRDPTIGTVESIAEALNVPLTIIFFLGTNHEDSPTLGKELSEKLSRLALELIGASNHE